MLISRQKLNIDRGRFFPRDYNLVLVIVLNFQHNFIPVNNFARVLGFACFEILFVYVLFIPNCVNR